MNKKDKWDSEEINELSGEESQNLNDFIISEKRINPILIILIIIISVGIFSYLKIKQDSFLEVKSEDYIKNEFFEEDFTLNNEDTNLFEEDITLNNEDSGALLDDLNLDTSDSNEFIKQFEEYKKNVEISKIIKAQEESYIVVENNNNVEMNDLELYVIYYDQNDNPIEIESLYFSSILPNSKSASALYNLPEKFTSFKFLLKPGLNGFDYYKSCPEDIIYNYIEDESTIMIFGENISDSKIDTVTFLVIYYNENNEIVDISVNSDFDITENQKYVFKVYKDLELEFDRYEVILQEAYRNS